MYLWMNVCFGHGLLPCCIPFLTKAHERTRNKTGHLVFFLVGVSYSIKKKAPKIKQKQARHLVPPANANNKNKKYRTSMTINTGTSEKLSVRKGSLSENTCSSSFSQYDDDDDDDGNSMELFFGQHQQQQDCKENNSSDDIAINTEQKVDYILSQLNEEDLETAARTSYEYIKKQQTIKKKKKQGNHKTDPSNAVSLQQKETQNEEENPAAATTADQWYYARNIAERYLHSKRGRTDVAVKKLRSTLKFRREINIDEIISAFDNVDANDDRRSSSSTSTTTTTGTTDMADKLEKGLSCKKFYVQGYDNDGRSTLYFIPRNVHGHDIEMTLKDAIYSIERAIACSKSSDHTINVIVDFSGFSIFRHSPPIDVGKKFMTSLRNHYAGQIHRIYLLDTPSTFTILWRMFQSFIGTSTRDKLHFVSGRYQKQQVMKNAYHINELPNWIISDGMKNQSLDMNEYLYNMKFDECY